MERDLLLRFIQETGLRTKSEVSDKFSAENPEILGGTIDYFVSKNQLRRAKYDAPEGVSELYFIPPGSRA
jgi:hypothetical protein